MLIYVNFHFQLIERIKKMSFIIITAATTINTRDVF